MKDVYKFLPLYSLVFLGFFGYALTISLFIPMLADKSFTILPELASQSLRSSLSGFLLAAYPLGQFLGSPIIGKLSDYYGRKKILLLSLIACVFGFSSIALSIEYHSLACLFVSCFVTGLCESNMSISQAIIVDSCDDDAKSKAKFVGYAFSACSLGYILGPLIGGITASYGGYSSPFWLTSVGVVFLFLWILVSFKTVKTENVSDTSKSNINFLNAITSFKSVFFDVKLRQFYLVNFLIFFSVQGLYRVAPLYVENKWEPSLQVFTAMIAYVSLLCMLANMFLLGPLARKFEIKYLLGGLLIFSGIFAILIVAPNSYVWTWITYGLAVIPTVMLLSTCTTWLSNQVPKERQGEVLGNNQALLVLGEALSAAVGGIISAVIIQLPIIIMGGILLTTFWVFFHQQNKSQLCSI